MTEIAIVKIVVFVYFAIIMLAVGIGTVTNILQAIGVHHLSEKLKLQRPWYSFIPYLNIYAIGRLGDECVKHTNKKRIGKVMFGMYIAYMVILVLLIAVAFNAGVNMALMEESVYLPENGDTYDSVINGALAGLVITYLIIIVFSVVYSIFYYVSLWRIFAAFDRPNAVVYEVLSVFVPILAPIFLFAIRKKEFVPEPIYGYIPQPVVQPIPQPVEQTEEQPAEETSEE